MIGDVFLFFGLCGLVVFANPFGMIILAFDDTVHRKCNIRTVIIGTVVSVLFILIGLFLSSFGYGGCYVG